MNFKYQISRLDSAKRANIKFPIYEWEKFDNPKLKELRKKLKLEDILSDGKTEFEKQLLLKSFVHNKLPLGNPSRDYSFLSFFEILEDAQKGLKLYCTQYSILFIQTASSLCWYSRKLGVDADHNADEKDMHHGICDIWSNDFNKWYVVDPMNNLHYEKNEIPLNVLEIRNEFLKNNAIDIEGIIGDKEKVIKFDKNSKGFNTPSNYFWFFISLRNNFFEKPGIFESKGLVWVDEFNKNKTWYKFKGQKQYEGKSIRTNDIALCFPKMK